MSVGTLNQTPTNMVCIYLTLTDMACVYLTLTDQRKKKVSILPLEHRHLICGQIYQNTGGDRQHLPPEEASQQKSSCPFLDWTHLLIQHNEEKLMTINITGIYLTHGFEGTYSHKLDQDDHIK